jgi:hypothetical protein
VVLTFPAAEVRRFEGIARAFNGGPISVRAASVLWGITDKAARKRVDRSPKVRAVRLLNEHGYTEAVLVCRGDVEDWGKFPRWRVPERWCENLRGQIALAL